MNYSYWLEHEWKKNKNYRPEGPRIQLYLRVSSKIQDREQQFNNFVEMIDLFELPEANLLPHIEENCGNSQRWTPAKVKKGLRTITKMVKEKTCDIIWVDCIDRLGCGTTWDKIYTLCRDKDVEIFCTKDKAGEFGSWLTQEERKLAIMTESKSAMDEVIAKSDRSIFKMRELAKEGRFSGGDVGICCDIIVKKFIKTNKPVDDITAKWKKKTLEHYEYVCDLYELELTSVAYKKVGDFKRTIKRTWLHNGKIEYLNAKPPLVKGEEFSYRICTKNKERIDAIIWLFNYFDTHDVTYDKLAKMWDEMGFAKQWDTVMNPQTIRRYLMDFSVIGKPVYYKNSHGPFSRIIDGEIRRTKPADFIDDTDDTDDGKLPQRNFMNDPSQWVMPDEPLWEPIVPLELFYRVQEKVKARTLSAPRNKANAQQRAPRSPLAYLNGLIFCGCGKKMKLANGSRVNKCCYSYLCKKTKYDGQHNCKQKRIRNYIFDELLMKYLDEVDKPFLPELESQVFSIEAKKYNEALENGYRDAFNADNNLIDEMLEGYTKNSTCIASTVFGELNAIKILHTELGSGIVVPMEHKALFGSIPVVTWGEDKLGESQDELRASYDKQQMNRGISMIKIDEVYDIFHNHNKQIVENKIEELQTKKLNLKQNKLQLMMESKQDAELLMAASDMINSLEDEISLLRNELINKADVRKDKWSKIKKLQDDVVAAKAKWNDKLALRSYLNDIIDKIVVSVGDVGERTITFIPKGVNVEQITYNESDAPQIKVAVRTDADYIRIGKMWFDSDTKKYNKKLIAKGKPPMERVASNEKLLEIGKNREAYRLNYNKTHKDEINKRQRDLYKEQQLKGNN